MSALTQFNVSQTFNVPAHPGLEVPGYSDPTHPNIPPLKSSYVFRHRLLGDVLAFLHHSAGDGLFLCGPTGSGKSTLISQIAARLNWPVQSVTCHGRLEFQSLIGQFVLVNGSTEFVHGPLAVAARDGHILILNELDMMDPAELAGLNDIIEGQPLVIAENGGEVIHPHPQFRLIATGNSLGSGDNTGLYQGVLRQNLAFMDRFRIIHVDYPDPEAEKEMLQAAVPSLPEEIVSRMLSVAGEVRRLFMGSDSEAGQLTVTMSTRTLVRWATLAATFKGAPNVFEYSLNQALTARAEAEQREAIHRIAADVFGDYWQSSNC
ncbi:aerobic cobaltochelatase CobS subunit [Halorhodospira halochloris]|uniref:Aerobic cobaltochelatase CobS subunit n=1 Tax=Halorhodospira halochloris TaxID=1052 RepID=A0A120MZX8_HALHR|nr:CbbQ/NirQ/NorQ/GpvN family protein [Halorhodospira halochloris]MBK1653042.1 CbbQ/NirQ/NorQ/GpvN family protein [Halorhodospira halochloris]BAU58137.1 aerobic cobaltochelatase CobS subunit [Halorhodospira halochloris]